MAPLFLRGQRLHRLRSLPGNIVVHDLRKGIPYADDCTDIVYHSHLLEHIDRDAASGFFTEVMRVLRPGGLHRIVVPDLERLTRAYLEHLDRFADPANWEDAASHDRYIGAIIEQSVRREAHGTSQQPPVRRFLENRLLGDARRRGETHQWMYDRVNLAYLLQSCNFRDVRVLRFDESTASDWRSYQLDSNVDGSEYKPGSLYVEARKPA